MIKYITILFLALIIGMICFLPSVSPVLYASEYTVDLAPSSKVLLSAEKKPCTTNLFEPGIRSLILYDCSDEYGHMLDLIPAEVGRIDCNDRYAWGESAGWVDFQPERGEVSIGANILSGWIRIEKLGWVNLGNGRPRNGYSYSNDDCRDYGVNNDGKGQLSGWGWGENVGWIDFNGVEIGRFGGFTGFAHSPKIGKIVFESRESVAFMVKTDPYPWKKIGLVDEIKLGCGSFPAKQGETLNPASSSQAPNYSPQSSNLVFYSSGWQKIVNAEIVHTIDSDEEIGVCLLKEGGGKTRGPPSGEMCLIMLFEEEKFNPALS